MITAWSRSHFGRLQVERDVGKGSLESDPCWYVHIENKLLKRLTDLFVRKIVVANERGEVGVEIGKGLRAGRFALERVEEVDDLSQRRAKMFGRPALRFTVNAAKTGTQKVAKIPTNTINRELAQVVQMKVSIDMGFSHFLSVDSIEPIGLAHFAGDMLFSPCRE